MILRKVTSNSADRATEERATEASIEQANSSAEESTQTLSPELRDELLDPEGWHKVLETFARTMRLAVALTDSEGRLLGKCHNPQPAWRLAREARPSVHSTCPFCLAPPGFCTALEDALLTNKVVMAEDHAGLAHAAAPLSLHGRPLGVLLAGQVFTGYPEPLPLQRVARELGLPAQKLWREAVDQVPVSRTTLQIYAELLMSLGQAFLGQRYAAILQRKLAQTGQRYRLFIEGVKDYALFTMDGSGRVTSWNSGAERLFGYTEAEIIGQDSSRFVLPENVHRETRRQAMSEADRAGSIDWEGWGIRKDGSRFFSGGLLASMGTGDFREYGALLRDVSELRHSEEGLRQSKKLEGLGLLAGGIAHDFNNLLTGIMGALSYAKTSLPADNPVYALVEIAEQSGVRAAELVAQLLAYAGKGKFVITRFDVSALISDLLPLISSRIPKAVELKLSLEPEPLWIEADATQIRQVVMNVIINGAEAIGPEGGTVRVSTGVTGSGKHIFIEVNDSGCGMSEATKAQMFEPFFSTKIMGRGLGLAAVAGIVRSHKGSVEVDSSPGQGTTFTVCLPVASSPVLTPVDSAPVNLSKGIGTVLIVDDELVLRRVARMILEKAGYTVLIAEDGGEGVEVFRENAPRIAAVLLDMTMPIMGGHEAFLMMRQIQPDVPIIISSGYSELFAREEIGQDAVFAFLQKPYTATKLVAMVQEVVRRPE